MKIYSVRRFDHRQPAQWFIVVADERTPGKVAPMPLSGCFTDLKYADAEAVRLNLGGA